LLKYGSDFTYNEVTAFKHFVTGLLTVGGLALFFMLMLLSNNMEFPDLLGRPARTITATCTRVSRESVVIESLDNPGKFRRLTVRERACLQGFPISYQFYGDSYAQKLKMIGNAIPPLFTFYVAQSILQIDPFELVTPTEAYAVFEPPIIKPPTTLPDTVGAVYPPTRKFRSAIPHLRFKSGVRFDLSNKLSGETVEWSVGLFFGNSKDIQRIQLGREVLEEILGHVEIDLEVVRRYLAKMELEIGATNAGDLQEEWTHRKKNKGGPFALVDKLGETTAAVGELLSDKPLLAGKILTDFLLRRNSPPGRDKLLRHAVMVLAGLIVGSAANVSLESDLFNKRQVRVKSAH
jgi:DNA (cytosine-5)-methyltransferase 1